MPRTYKQKKRKVRIGVDFDGVICPYNRDYRGAGVYTAPVEGAVQGMTALAQSGYELIINSCRGETEALEEYLNEYKIPYHGINTHQPEKTTPKKFIRNSHKIFCDIYLDDRGLQFHGDWAATVQSIESYTIWYKRKGSKYEGYPDKVGYGSEYETLLDHATSFIRYQTIPFIQTLAKKAIDEDPIVKERLKSLEASLEGLVGLVECS